MLRDEPDIDDTLHRISQKEVGLKIDFTKKRYIGQFKAIFENEGRVDISTCYAVKADFSQAIVINPTHFSEHLLLPHSDPIPEPIGEMYRHYLEVYRRDRFKS